MWYRHETGAAPPPAGDSSRAIAWLERVKPIGGLRWSIPSVCQTAVWFREDQTAWPGHEPQDDAHGGSHQSLLGQEEGISNGSSLIIGVV